jgi:hypothetical protein
VILPLSVRAWNPAQQGRFVAWSERGISNGGLGAALTLRVTPTGAYTLQQRVGGRTKSARGFMYPSAPQVRAVVDGQAVELSLEALSGVVGGSQGGALVRGWRAVWDARLNPAAARQGYYSAGLVVGEGHEDETGVPQGMGFLTFSVGLNGDLRLRGKSADGQNLVAASSLGAEGEFLIYAVQHWNQGSIVGEVTLKVDGAAPFVGNLLDGRLSWSKPETRGRVYAGAFGPVVVDVVRGYLAADARSGLAVGGLDPGLMALEFVGAGIEESATEADVVGIEWTERQQMVMPSGGNAAGVQLRVNARSGAVSGRFSLAESSPGLERRQVPFLGQVVRTGDAEVRAIGFFLLPQLPLAGQTLRTSPIQSGSVFLIQSSP